MFADDIALTAETEEDLQCMLNALHSWCECWHSASILAKQKLFTSYKIPSLEPLLNSSVALHK